MIYFDRNLVNAPTKLSNDTYKKKIYLDLYDENNNIKPRWNNIRENNKRVIREHLINITNGCCAYCGKKIKDSDMDVEHFLPSHEYPYLAYCLENLLPSCKKCNQNYKNKFVPSEIKGKKIIEACMKKHKKFDYIYDKQMILNDLCKNSRIIEPTFDNIEEHLVFNPEFYMYEAKSSMGENTKQMFFDKSEFIKELEEISAVVKEIVKMDREDNYEVIQYFIRLQGYAFYFNKFYEYWINEKENNRLYI